MILKKIRDLGRRMAGIIIPSRNTLYRCGLVILWTIVSFFVISHFVNFIGSVHIALMIAYLLLFLVIGGGIAWGVSLLLGLAGRVPPVLRIAIVLTVLCLFYYFFLPKTYGRILLAFFVLLPGFVAVGIYKWRKGELFPLSDVSRWFMLVLFIIGAGGIITGAGLYLSPGKTVPHTENVKMLGNHLPEVIRAADPSEKGSYKVGYLTYGSGKDRRRAEFGDDVTLKTEPVDASLILKSWTGFSGKLRSWYFGFDQSELPLNARVWYPEKPEVSAPLIVIVHGNHLAQDYSDGGYAYLGELLASRGYIVVSVDENFLNGSLTDFQHFGGGLKQENAARGWLLLKHLQQWKAWNSDPSCMFHGQVDMDRIALIGHSRGGEAVGHAALFNRLPAFPDDAGLDFDFNFNIRSVVAIAPVDGQYKPSSELTSPKDINYFVLQGTHDMDMESYGGLATYKRVKFSPGYTGFKAGIYIHRANHGQFNSSWGKRDWVSPNVNRFNLKQLLKEEEQQQVAKVYISAFLEATLRDNTVYKPLFMDYRYGRDWLPDLVYLNQFENSRTFTVADYEEDMDLQSASLPGSVIRGENLSVWSEKQQRLMWGSHISKAVHIGWDRSKADSLLGTYTITLPDSLPVVSDRRLLVFSLVQSDESPAHKADKDEPGTGGDAKESKKEKTSGEEKKEKEQMDFTIELSDSQGEKISFPLSRCSFLQPRIGKNLSKFAFLNNSQDSEAIPDFFYFDIAKLAKDNPAFSPGQIRKIRFVFDRCKSGVIILDDLGFTGENEREATDL